MCAPTLAQPQTCGASDSLCVACVQMLNDKFTSLYFELAESSGLKFVRAEVRGSQLAAHLRPPDEHIMAHSRVAASRRVPPQREPAGRGFGRSTPPPAAHLSPTTTPTPICAYG